jgi:hypothetical protein
MTSDPFLKAPNEVLDFEQNWFDSLDDDETISTSTWTATGLTISSQQNTASNATVWLGGGTHGQEYLAVNEIITSAGRTIERSIKILCRNR